MVELQSCGSLVKASASCAIEQEVKGESSVINGSAEISAELQKEREKNAQLMKRISVLEAQIQGRDKELFMSNGQSYPDSLVDQYQDNCVNAIQRSLKKFKRQKIGTFQNGIEDRNGEITSQSQITLDTQCHPPKVEDRLVNWMSMNETQFSHSDKLKYDDLAVDCDDTDDSHEEDDCEEVDAHIDQKTGETCAKADQLDVHEHKNGVDEGTYTASLGNVFGRQNVAACINQADCILSNTHINKGIQKEQKTSGDNPVPKKEACQTTGPGNISSIRKVAFCPKEVKRILESEGLLVKNAQSHTIRKIIIFASLGIRHGCDDMYELDLSNFSILRKGEPYVSPKDPGEHVLYENPGARRKIFFPNRQNPTLCPVQILEEEKAMRPSDPSCPSCLFLCIKYGGRTRNLPQNEYVRQRMGRNKLKSFGPVMCRMAMLVHIRNGSFFFKALGITLLFMAGFPDDLVQRETKYRNLDLLQKYYRTDENAEGEKLFLPHPITCDTQPSPGSEKLTGKTVSIKSKGKKQANFICNLPRSSVSQSVLSSISPPTQFGLMGYNSIQTQATPSFQSMPPHTPQDILQVPNQVMNSCSTNNPTQYHMFPPQPANAFMPVVYWSAPNAFPPNPYASTYSYQAFPSNANYISTHPHLYYIQPSCNSLIPKMTEERNWKNDSALKEADSDSDTSSSTTEPKEASASCK